jgi:hypothetical protein
MSAWLKQRGYRVTHALKGHVDVAVLIDPRDDLRYKAFGRPDVPRVPEADPGAAVQ